MISTYTTHIKPRPPANHKLHHSQVVKAMDEAERYSGTSVVLAYAPCTMHGIHGGMSNALEEAKEVTDTGRSTCMLMMACM